MDQVALARQINQARCKDSREREKKKRDGLKDNEKGPAGSVSAGRGRVGRWFVGRRVSTVKETNKRDEIKDVDGEGMARKVVDE